MSRTARTYARVTEAETIIKSLCEKYPDLLWSVKYGQVAVMGIDNTTRSEKAVAKNPAHAKLRLVKGAEKALFETNNIPVRYIVECYWSDWNVWGSAAKQCILLNALMEITPEEEKRNSPDCVGFNVLIDVFGVNWTKNLASLPNLLSTDVKFDLDLRPGLNADGEPEQESGE